MELNKTERDLLFNPEEYTLEEILKPKKCALLVVDIQNDFCDPRGFFATELGADINSMQSVVAHIQELINLAHTSNIPVIFTLGYEDPKFRDEPGKRRYCKWEMNGRICTKKGTFGAEFYRLSPQPRDIIIEKYDWTAFSGREKFHKEDELGKGLEDILKERNVQTLVVAGVKTEVCMNATVTDAKSRGYFVVVPREAVATDRHDLHQVYLEGWDFSSGDVVRKEEIKKNWTTNYFSREH